MIHPTRHPRLTELDHALAITTIPEWPKYQAARQ